MLSPSHFCPLLGNITKSYKIRRNKKQYFLPHILDRQYGSKKWMLNMELLAQQHEVCTALKGLKPSHVLVCSQLLKHTVEISLNLNVIKTTSRPCGNHLYYTPTASLPGCA